MSTMGVYQLSVAIVLIFVLCMYLIYVSGFVDSDDLHIGLEHYAEIIRFPTADIMPLNTLVNIGYIGVGLYWCGITKAFSAQGILKTSDSFFFYLFNNLACMYGSVSVVRMITQKALWAIIDRWSTLLFFALVPLWASHIRGQCTPWLFVSVMAVSFCSYSLSLVFSYGYEAVIGFHILCAIFGGYKAYSWLPSNESLYFFYRALGSCAIFVSFNLLDLYLPSISFVFNFISGHVISRIFDASQIYFVNAFFYDLTLEKAAVISLEEKKRWIKEDDELRERIGNDIAYENPMKFKEL